MVMYIKGKEALFQILTISGEYISNLIKEH